MSGIAILGEDRADPFRDLTIWLWRRPEWWSLGLAAAAWAVIVRNHWGGAPICHAGPSSWPDRIASWLLMMVAMMVPMLVPGIRVVAQRSLWRRRNRAIAVFLFGYLGPWFAVGLLLSAMLAEWTWTGAKWAGVAGFMIAAGWQLTSGKRRALRACHHTAPLTPGGWRADRDCAVFGWRVGLRCVASCWALMLTCFLARHSVLAMTVVTGVCTSERYLLRPDQRVMSAMLLAAAVLYVVAN